MNKFETIEVVCPFYIREIKTQINCEGINEDSRLHLQFIHKSEFSKHKAKFCKDMKNYENCPLARIISEQYEKEAKNE